LKIASQAWVASLLVGVAGGAIGASAIMGLLSKGTAQARETPPAEDHAVIAWIAETPGIPDQLRRSVLLDRIEIHPSDAQSLVEALRHLSPSTTRPATADVALNLLVTEKLEQSLSKVTAAADVRAIAQLRRDLIEKARQTLAEEEARLAGAVADFQADKDAVLPPADWSADADRLLALEADAGAESSRMSPVLSGIVSRALAISEARLKYARERIRSIDSRSQDGVAIEPSAPGSTPAEGTCAAELLTIRSLRAKLADDRLNRWASAASAADDTSVRKTSSETEAVLEDLSRAQVMLYNLWAIRQINAAEDSPQWPDYLGTIDRSLLHPSVSAMWNLVHDRRFAEVQKREDRPSTVRRLLNAHLVGLERF
jgi:hypothetical protein